MEELGAREDYTPKLKRPAVSTSYIADADTMHESWKGQETHLLRESPC